MESKNEQRTDEILASLDNIRQAEPSPFLYNKILNRISEAREEWTPKKVVWLAAASFAILILLNWQLLKGRVGHAEKQYHETEVKDQTYSIYPTNEISYN